MRKDHHGRLRNTVVGIGILAILGACGRSPSSNDTTEVSDLAIVGGSDVLASSTSIARTGTVALTNAELFAEGRSFCTATLIGANQLLTAAHCITDSSGVISTEPMYAVFDLVMGRNAQLARSITAIAVHRNYDTNVVGRVDPTLQAANDLAVIAFSGSVPAPWKPVPVVAADATYAPDQPVLLAGYGVTATRSVNTTGTLRSVRARIQRSRTPGNVLIIRGPNLNANAIDASSSGEAIVVPANGGACAGDSGGPAYASVNGAIVVAGATSYGSELRLESRPFGPRYCIGENGYVDLRAYAAGIASASRALGSISSAAESRALRRFVFTNAGTAELR